MYQYKEFITIKEVNDFIKVFPKSRLLEIDKEKFIVEYECFTLTLPL
jgi:hypothetical protein